jgi:hypothetical protein
LNRDRTTYPFAEAAHPQKKRFRQPQRNERHEISKATAQAGASGPLSGPELQFCRYSVQNFEAVHCICQSCEISAEPGRIGIPFLIYRGIGVRMLHLHGTIELLQRNQDILRALVPSSMFDQVSFIRKLRYMSVVQIFSNETGSSWD